ncbi:TPA: hypothetical protein G5V04_003397 [Salmonella enterica]|nr:hypothetical protein [Salmonella enterica]
MTETDQTTEPVQDQSGNAYHRHYRITSHAIDRYIERIGGDLGNMIADLDSCWLFNPHQKGLKRKMYASAARCEREGGYALFNGRVMFLVNPLSHQHIVLTTLSMD